MSNSKNSQLSSSPLKYFLIVRITQAFLPQTKISNFTRSEKFFCRVESNGIHKNISSTKPSENPIWNDSCNFSFTGNVPKQLLITIMSKNMFRSKAIGTARVPVVFKTNECVSEYKKYPLLFFGKKSTYNIRKIGEIEAQVLCSSSHSKSFFYDQMDFNCILKITLKDIKTQKKFQINKFNPHCVFSFGTKKYRSTPSLNYFKPTLGESCLFFVNVDRDKNFIIKILIINYNSIGKKDIYGVSYLKLNKELNFQSFQDKQNVKLSVFEYFGDFDINVSKIINGEYSKGDSKGNIDLEIELITRKFFENKIFYNFDHDQKYNFLITVNNFKKLINGLKLKKKTLKQIDSQLEKIGKQTLTYLDVFKIMFSIKIKKETLFYKFLIFHLKSSDKKLRFMDCVHRGNLFSSVLVQDRESGLITTEYIPKYVKYAMKIMYSKRIFPKIVSKKLLKLSKSYGRKYDLEKNDKKTKMQINSFVKKYNININEIKDSLESFKTFNDFFARNVKPESRPISDPQNDKILVSPADCRLSVFERVFEATRFWIKGQNFSIERLLGPKLSDLASQYKSCSLVISRLAPQDYHRWHLPFSGKMEMVSFIDGSLFTVNPIAVNSRTDVFTANKRVICEFDTKFFGRGLVVGIGATCVGCIKIFDSTENEIKNIPDIKVKCNETYRKGQIHGEFRFGGSTLLLFLKSDKVKLDKDLVSKMKIDNPLEVYVRAGSRIGIAK